MGGFGYGKHHPSGKIDAMEQQRRDKEAGAAVRRLNNKKSASQVASISDRLFAEAEKQKAVRDKLAAVAKRRVPHVWQIELRDHIPCHIPTVGSTNPQISVVGSRADPIRPEKSPRR